MAFGDAFGTNLFSVMLLFVADLAYAGGPILNEVDRFSLFATLLGILLTSVYLAGVVERRSQIDLRDGCRFSDCAGRVHRRAESSVLSAIENARDISARCG